MKKAVVFTDGASRGNPGPTGWGAVIASDAQVAEIGAHIPEGTNNQAELAAVVATLDFLITKNSSIDSVTIYSDSTYTISGATGWIHGWRKRDWQTKTGDPVKNQPLWKEFDRLQTEANFSVTFSKVKGHASVPGNERADEIATSFADGETPELFSGPQENYTVSLDPEPQYLETSPLYLSLIDGVAYRDSSWDDCKERVAGSPAVYKKVRTVAERDELLDKWGVDLADIRE